MERIDLTIRKALRISGLIFISSSVFSGVVLGADISTAASGRWNAPSTWKGGIVPGAGDHVFIEAGHAVSLTADQACGDLNLNASSGQPRLSTGSYTLSVNGKLRAFNGSAPGASTTAVPSSSGWIDTSGGGRLILAGNSRTITSAGEWGANPPGWNLEIAANPRQVLTCATPIKAGTIRVASGTLNMAAAQRLAPDNGNAGTGTLIVEAGATVVMSSNASVQRVATPGMGSHCGAVDVRGTLSFSGSVGAVAAAAIRLPGTVEYSAAGPQTLMTKGANSNGANPSTYGALKLSGSGAKSLGLPTSVTGLLTLAGAATLSLGSFTLSYGETSTLEYAGPEPQRTGDTEFPAVGGPANLTVSNAKGLTLHDSRTLPGLLNLAGGDLITGEHLLIHGGESNGPGDVVGTVRRLDLGAVPRSFGNPQNRITVTAGTPPATMEITLVKTAPSDFERAVARYYVLSPAPGGGFTSRVRLRYLSSELNGNAKSALELYRFDGVHWVKQPKMANDDVEDWVETAGAMASSSWMIYGGSLSLSGN